MKYLVFILILFQIAFLTATNTAKLKQLSLESLLQIPVLSSTYYDIDELIEPSSITVITKDQISSAPVNNVLDILEVYVPGFTYVEHFMGPRMGLRGVLSDQNISYLLLVNGKNLNLKYQWGPLHELQNKDLGDIHEIRVIHGPVSVTHGPGAIAGVIDIRTLSGKNEHVAVAHTSNFVYNYNTTSAMLSLDDIISSSFYASSTKANGDKNTQYWYTDRAHGYGWGFMSPDWGDMDTGSLAPNYLSSYRDEKEYKAQIEMSFGKYLDLWSRYTTFSYPHTTQSSLEEEGAAWAGFRIKSFSIEGVNRMELGQSVDIETKLGYDSSSIQETALWQREALSIDHIAQQKNAFSENEVNLRSTLKWNIQDKLVFTFGTELMYEYYKQAWGEDEDDFLMSYQTGIRFAVYNEDSGFYNYYPTLTTVIDETIDGFTYSFFGEAYYEINDIFRLIPSVRMDKNEYADPAYSYRISASAKTSDSSSIIVTAQESVRLPTFMNLYSSDYNNDNDARNEILRGFELIHRNKVSKKFSYSGNLYYNQIDQVAWNQEQESPDVLGQLDLFGVEINARYNTGLHSFGFSYSFVHQVDWEEEKEQVAYVSGQDASEAYIDDYGENRINNLPKHMFKFYDCIKLSQNLRLNVNGRFAFDYQQQELLDMFEEAHQEIADQELIIGMHSLLDDLDEYGYGKPSFTSGLAINWSIPYDKLNISMKLNIDNIISFNNIRYVIQYWEDGNLRQYPRQVGFIKEPVNFGVEVMIKV